MAPPPAGRLADPRCAFVQLPQQVPGAGYYNYGTPPHGAGQYEVPDAIGLIQQVSRGWEGPKFGVGNMSLAGGGKFPGHGRHKWGKSIDMRPMRVDGAPAPATWRSPNYDRAATQRLIDAIRASAKVDSIWFNDPKIRRVTSMGGHDNHLHVNVRSTCPGL